jgi:hypothetical protein
VNSSRLVALVFAAFVIGSTAAPGETLSPLPDGKAPKTYDELWKGFDPRAEPLDIEVLKEWETEDVTLRVLRFRVGVFKGKKAILAAVYGFPKGGTRLPGLVQIHGGGQYADHKACLMNAKRGYATVSISWAGRISAPGYRVSPNEVKLFWEGKIDDPKYKITTDWGALDAYHAPSRNGKDAFVTICDGSEDWTLDDVESPRNSSWFLCTMAARRALTFLEEQPEVDRDRLGVYGHSMGGKLTVATAATDPRVKAAAPSCGGISDRYSKNPLHQNTIGDAPALKRVTCPIIFLSPANDFHGRIGDLPTAIDEIKSDDWRVTCSPHHNHQDTSPYEVATLLWMDQHLKGSFTFPNTPECELKLSAKDGVPTFGVKPDGARKILSVDIFYTQQGAATPASEDLRDAQHRFWHHASAKETDGAWTARLRLVSMDKPLWVYANVRYALDQPVSGAGYYYGLYTAKTFNVSSLLTTASPKELKVAKARVALTRKHLIEDFAGDWKKEWFTYKSAEWARSTHKLNEDIWKAPKGATLVLDVQSADSNTMVVLLDSHAAEVKLIGGKPWQTIELTPADFRNVAGESRLNWTGIRRLKLSHAEHLRPKLGDQRKPRLVGKNWQGDPPRFRNLRWQPKHCLLEFPRPPRTNDYQWTTSHMHVGVRWQPFIGRPDNNAYDATRPVLARDSGYVQFWASWGSVEPTPANTNYAANPSAGLQALERAVDACHARGQKVEFVFFHCPRWASESGKSGGQKPKDGLFEGYARRIAKHFKGRVHAYQLSHEANNQGLMHGADADFIINEILLKGAQTIREVYETEPAVPVLLSTTGMSPCETCGPREGLDGRGGRAVNHFYDLMVGHRELMQTVDALNLNVSDNADGYGNMDGSYVSSAWGNYDLVRGKLDAAGYPGKSVLSSESWIAWDDAGHAKDVNGDGRKDELDAYEKAITILGQCLQRGLNTLNLPWSDNSSSWAMGLTKRRDYNGRVKQLKPDIVIPATDGGPDIITRKLGLRGQDDTFEIVDGAGHQFTIEDYLNPPDPNHLHYYIWKWYAQIAGGTDEVIRHAVAGESGNDIAVNGDGFTGNERFRIASWNRTRQQFIVLIYASGANGKTAAKVSIPSKIMTGRHYNHDHSHIDFRGEGFNDGDTYTAHIITKEISDQDGSDSTPFHHETPIATVANESLTVTVPNIRRFTTIQFTKR